MDLPHLVGQALCHQMPERSFFIDGHQLCVCSRCTGIYWGALAGWLHLIFRRRLNATAWPMAANRWIILIFMGFMPLDAMAGLLFGHDSGNAFRFLVGVGFGYGALLFLQPFVARRLQPSKSVASFSDRYDWMLWVVLVILTNLFFWPEIGIESYRIYTAVTLAGVLVLITQPNLLIITYLIFPQTCFNNDKLKSCLIAGGIVLTVFELAFFHVHRYLITTFGEFL